MSKVHYFQRYSQRENVATNNTLLLISRLYAHEPSYLEAFLNDLVETGALEVGPSFIQQATHRYRPQVLPGRQILRDRFQEGVVRRVERSAIPGAH